VLSASVRCLSGHPVLPPGGHYLQLPLFHDCPSQTAEKLFGQPASASPAFVACNDHQQSETFRYMLRLMVLMFSAFLLFLADFL
jgi:hypothetical protein